MKIITFASITFFIIILVVFATTTGSAQGQNQEVTIIAPYKPTISDAEKIPVIATIRDTVVKVPEMNYSIVSRPITTTYEIEPLKPVFLQIEPGQNISRNYLKAGFGNYTTPYAEFFANSLSSEKYSLGFHVRHLSSQGEIKDYPVSNFSSNRASVYGKRYLSGKVLSADVFYDRNVVHYYGVKKDDTAVFSLPDDDLRQRFSLFGGNLTLASNSKRRNTAGYIAGLRFYHLSDLFNTRETGFTLHSGISKPENILDIASEEKLGLSFNLDFWNNKDSIVSQGNVIATINPYLQLDFEHLNLTLGAQGAFSADSSGSVYVYPAVKASFKVIPDHLRVYFSASGGLSRNSFYVVSRENPWINSVFPFGFTNTKYEFKGGVTGQISQMINFNLSAAYSDAENILLLVNDFNSYFKPDVPLNFANKFTGIYDNAEITTISAEIGYEQPQKINALLVVNYTDYSMEKEEHPWHKPALEVSLFSRYFVDSKLSVSGELFFRGKAYAKIDESPAATEAVRKAYLDVNLSAEYRLRDKISAFVLLNNMTATRYYRWYNYPSQRINAMAGMIFAF